MMRCSRLVIVALLLIPVAGARPGEKPQVPSEREIKKLVDQLVSPNPKPITGDEDERVEPEYRLPRGFDKDKQKQVHAARYQLKQIGPAAFPFLIERWKDKRYCMTVSHGLSGYCYNWTVGQVCEAIAFDQLQPYSTWPAGYDDPRGKPKSPDYPPHFLSSQKAARKWWEKNKQKTLYQMQLEILDWVIAEEAKRPKDYTDKDRQALRSLRKELVKDVKPLSRGNYFSVDIEQ
jgi:hypothetical protein